MDAVGGYQLLGRVSDSRLVSVWKGRHPASARQVALKQVELTSDGAITRLRAQVRVLAGVSHPGIVETLELIEDQQQAWLVEDWVDGVLVPELLAAGGPLSAEQSVAVLCDSLAGLAHVHHRAIVHGNIVAENLLLDETGAAKVADFGAARDYDGHPMTLRSDVQGAALILAALLPESPARVGAVIERALADEPTGGFRDAGEFRVALEAAAVRDFGAEWRERADLSERVRAVMTPRPDVVAEQPADQPIGVAGSAELSIAPPPMVDHSQSMLPSAHPMAHRVKVRSPKRPTRTKQQVADVREYLEPRARRGPGSDGNTGKLIPIIAGVVVVIAIVVLILTRQDTKKATAAGLSFHGTYAITATLKSAGVGAEQGQPAGSVRSQQWQVTPSCPASGSCTASVLPSTGAAFTLQFVNGSWTGEQAMPATGGCAGIYSFTLTPASSSAKTLAGALAGVVAGCTQAGTEAGSLVATRA